MAWKKASAHLWRMCGRCESYCITACNVCNCGVLEQMTNAETVSCKIGSKPIKQVAFLKQQASTIAFETVSPAPLLQRRVVVRVRPSLQKQIYRRRSPRLCVCVFLLKQSEFRFSMAAVCDRRTPVRGNKAYFFAPSRESKFRFSAFQ